MILLGKLYLSSLNCNLLSTFSTVKQLKYNNGVLIGVFSAVLCGLLTYTYIIPLIVTVPVGSEYERIAASLINDEPYSNVAKLTIALLSITLSLMIWLVLWVCYKLAKRNDPPSMFLVVLMMFCCCWILCPLSF